MTGTAQWHETHCSNRQSGPDGSSGGLILVLVALGQGNFIPQRLGRLPGTVIEIETEQVPFFPLVTFLPHIPVAVPVGVDGKSSELLMPSRPGVM